MDDGTVNIQSGININIKRTDGRIHSAIVSGVNVETRSVTVEWFERGETKGKEVEIDTILALNPELIGTRRSPHLQPVSNAPNKLARDMTRQSIPVATKAPARVTRNNQMRMSNAGAYTNGHGGDTTGRRGAENVPPPPQPQQQPPSNSRLTQQMPASGGRSRTGSTPSAASLTQQHSHHPHHAQHPPNSGQKRMQNIKEFSNSGGGGAGGGGGGMARNTAASASAASVPHAVASGAVRRSNVVKEVERLKENREKRRQRQAELKEEKEALMNMDPGNPNWEFLAMIREYQSSIEFRPLVGSEPVEDHQITVCVRKRPLNKKEINKKEVDVISVPTKDQMIVHEPKNKVDLTKYLENQKFRFDYAFDDSCTNEIVYKYTAKPLVQTIFEGGMATCFAYGQTGSGKTHTMGGDFQGKIQDCKKGIYAMAARDVFTYLKSPKYKPLNLIVSASFFEIYSGKVFDLLADKAKLRVLEDGKQQVQIVGLTERCVDSVDEVLRLIQHGNAARTSGQTSANSNSSRSHAVFQIVVRSPGMNRVHGKFSLIDLAGNERGADTSSANRQTRMESAEINKSLLALKECIRALGMKGNNHLPFRVSKLTQVLRDSFIGDKSRTCMIAMISPAMSSCEHSLNTLRYADRVKELGTAEGARGRPESPLADVDMEPPGHELAQLRSLNEGDMSAEMFTFHEVIDELQRAEEEVLDNHKAVADYMQHALQRCSQLFAITRDVDYDQDAYATQWEELLNEQLVVLAQSRDLVAKFRAKMQQEEHMSRRIQPRHH
ncbi:PREDICTED: kinesin-like protein KIF2A isoform X1 [Papilio xuthus]|uniref:Kinesin-like protein n=1 Tax=Papilio xuthus TaxID=66420 RepID=A0AAJ6ZPA9_PAPXU|nr:PREDICTED: kinesin-like protein KIF2A isoform X1 [Papilio xuthus]XP_013176663.1 PREDICTED: kinesin-like protein KIF2A isoform X1 [Papilio xuthus]